MFLFCFTVFLSLFVTHRSRTAKARVSLFFSKSAYGGESSGCSPKCFRDDKCLLFNNKFLVIPESFMRTSHCAHPGLAPGYKGRNGLVSVACPGPPTQYLFKLLPPDTSPYAVASSKPSCGAGKKGSPTSQYHLSDPIHAAHSAPKGPLHEFLGSYCVHPNSGL